MIEVKIEAIRVNLIGSHRVIILKELSSERYLPIWIGQAEADSITIQLTETQVARPLTHDLVLAMIVERLIRPCSKLATTRLWHSTTLADVLSVADAQEDELYAARQTGCWPANPGLSRSWRRAIWGKAGKCSMM